MENSTDLLVLGIDLFDRRTAYISALYVFFKKFKLE
jgi:hypothetical protein